MVDFGKEKQESLSGKSDDTQIVFLLSHAIRTMADFPNRAGLTDKEIEDKVTGLVKTGI